MWCLTLATPHYCAANVRSIKAFPVTALWGSVDRSEAFWKLQGKPVLEAELVPALETVVSFVGYILYLCNVLYNRVPLC